MIKSGVGEDIIIDYLEQDLKKRTGNRINRPCEIFCVVVILHRF